VLTVSVKVHDDLALEFVYRVAKALRDSSSETATGTLEN
jgi:hypothetical protein